MAQVKTVSAAKLIAELRKVKGPKVVVADIETFPILGYVWRLFKQNVGIEQIHTDRSMMSACVKILGQDVIWYRDNRNADGPRDDFDLLLDLHGILMEVDMVVAHNGEKFDLPSIRARMAQQGFTPLPPIKVIDTLLNNRKQFGFTSHKLAYVSKYFASQEKDLHAQYPGFELWLGCERNEVAAWNACRKYNIQDVVANEEMYLELRGWYQGQHNFGPYIEPSNEDAHVCPTCGSEAVTKRGTRKTQVGIYHRYECGSCGGWSRGRYLIASRKDRAHILMS